jgi:hypothetical protein
MRIKSLRSFSALKGFTVLDRDGEAGTIDDAYFDNLRWAIRYLLLKHRPTNRDVLISPLIIDELRWPERRIGLRLYDEEIEAVPLIDTDEPITREQETSYNSYFFIPDYWAGDDLWGAESNPGDLRSRLRAEQEKVEGNGEGQSYLLSASDTQRYEVESPQGTVGSIRDFLWSLETYAIRFLVIDIGGVLASKKTLLSPLWITRLDREGERIFVDLPKTAMEDAPSYEMGEPITPAYEKNLMSHYNALEYKT